MVGTSTKELRHAQAFAAAAVAVRGRRRSHLGGPVRIHPPPRAEPVTAGRYIGVSVAPAAEAGEQAEEAEHQARAAGRGREPVNGSGFPDIDSLPGFADQGGTPKMDHRGPWGTGAPSRIACVGADDLKPVSASLRLGSLSMSQTRSFVHFREEPMATKPVKNASTKSATAALQKPLQPSAELAAVVGSDPVSRGEVTSKVWDYIKAHNLQNPENRREILADDKLRKVFGKDKVTLFEMTKHLSQHLT